MYNGGAFCARIFLHGGEPCATKVPVSDTNTTGSVVGCRCDPVLLGRLDRVAQANGISRSDVVRMALLRALPGYERAECLLGTPEPVAEKAPERQEVGA